MASAALPALFGVLGCLSVLLALRRDEGRTGYWLAALGLALALGFSLGGLLQDGRLISRSQALERELERLHRENETLAAQLEDFGLAPQPVAPGAPETALQIPVPAPSVQVSSSQPAEAVSDSADLFADASSPTAAPLASPTVQPAPEIVEAEASLAPEAAEDVGVLDLAGTWEMQTVIEETSYPPYLGLELLFGLELEQTGARLGGRGEKLSERLPNAPTLRTYPVGSRTPITLTGNFVGQDLLELTFVEEGAERSSGGEMVLRVVSPNRLEGSFASSSGAAGSVSFQKLVTASSSE